jgi:hypothetical protein
MCDVSMLSTFESAHCFLLGLFLGFRVQLGFHIRSLLYLV